MRDLLQRLDEQTVNYVFRQNCQPCVRQSTVGGGRLAAGGGRRTADGGRRTAGIQGLQGGTMVTMRELEQQFRVKPGKRLRLKEHDPGWSGDKEMRVLKGDALKERAKAFIQENLGRLEAVQ